jgi:hypothetical protein
VALSRGHVKYFAAQRTFRGTAPHLATDSFGAGLLVLGVIAVSGAAAALFIVPPNADLADGAGGARADVGRAA